jgi:hypothetical protein
LVVESRTAAIASPVFSFAQGSALVTPGWIRFTYWKLFSKPAHDRLIYRLIDRGQVTSVTEFGVPRGLRSERMIAFAKRHHPLDRIRYAGLDLFEARPASSPGYSLKEAHRVLNRSGVQVRLVPGDLLAGLLRSANSLPKTDLVVIDAGVDMASMPPAWFYFPRMLHEKSVVLVGTRVDGVGGYRQLNYAQVVELAKGAASAVRKVG